ncbi:hypothetical protein FGB62_261g06 [Gracilaria domingensis]|nr:hypothetical protein FGB62_261g06 [Gracilaria domingensis]
MYITSSRLTVQGLIASALLLAILPALGESTLQGQSRANRLRHGVAVSSLPSHFGKRGSAVLSRSVIPRSQIWNPGNLDPFIVEMFGRPEKLDWYVADVINMHQSTNPLITINGGFSCLDRGRSSSYPLTWWVSENLTELTELKSEPGGAEIRSLDDIQSPEDSESTVHDITEQCMSQRRADPSLRLVEHHGVHDGSGVSFRRFNRKAVPFIGDVNIFSDILAQRNAEDRSNPVVYNEKGIPIVFGLTFDSGFRVKVPDDFTTEKTLELRVPMTPLAAITYHTVARMQEENVGAGEPKTDGWILSLTLLSAALALLFAVGILSNFVSSAALKSSMVLRELPVQRAVIGTDHWLTHNKGTLVLHIFGAIILAAPLALAVADRHIDPRVYAEMTQGITVFYGSSQDMLSRDPENPVAGAPFIVTGWISFREINPSYHLHFLLLCVFIAIIAFAIIWQDALKMNSVMPGLRSQSLSVSLQKLFGRLLMSVKSKKGARQEWYTVLITLRQEYFDTLQLDRTRNRHFLKAILLLVNKEWRMKANLSSQDIEEQANAGAELYERLMRGGTNEPCRFSFVCRMKLDNRIRFESTMARIRWWWQASCPREWEYIRRGLQACFPLEHYHARGRYPPDAALVLLRLGLLDFLHFVDKVYVKRSTEHDGMYGEDDTKCFVVLSSPSSEILMSDSPPLSEDVARRDFIEFHPLERWRDAPELLRQWREGRMKVESLQMNGQRFGYAREAGFEFSTLNAL